MTTTKITTKHMDALTLHLADVLGGPKLTAAAVLDTAPTYDDLAAVDAGVVSEALRDAGVEASPLKRGAAARLFALLAPGAPVCNRCGRLPLTLTGSTWSAVTAPTCPVDAGLYVAPAAAPTLRGWHDGREYPADATHDAAGVPLTEAAIRTERGVWPTVDAALHETGATLLDVLAATVATGASPAEALTAIGSPLVRWPSVMALRAFVAQAKGAASRAPGGATPPPFASGGEAPPGAFSLREWRAVFAGIFPTAERARMLLNDAGIATSRINFGGTAETTWQSALDEAQKTGRLGALLAVARQEYPSNPALRALTAPRTADRSAVYDALVRLLPAQIEEVVFRLAVPSHYLPPASAPTAERAASVVRWAEQQGRLAELAARVRA